MHHTHSRPRRPSPAPWGAWTLALLLAGAFLGGPGGPAARAQEKVARRTILVPVNGTVRLQMSTKKPIRTVSNPKESALTIRTVVGDPTTVLLIGQQPDITRVQLTDADGNTEVYEVIVQPDVEYLQKQLQRALPQGSITPIPISRNSVILSGQLNRPEDAALASGVAQAAGYQAINALRVGGVQQVQLDVVIATVSRTEFRRMAFDFLTNGKNFFLGSTVGQAVINPRSTGVGAVLSNAPGGLLGIPGTPNGVRTNVLFGVLHDGWGFLGFLQALRDENVSKLLAEPRLVTLSGQPASFLVGGEQAIPVPAGLGQVGVQFEEFGTRLNFLPIVLGNGRIHLEVEPEVSNLDPAAGTAISGTIVPGRVTNRVHTTVELETGQTFVIGGLIQHTVTASATKLPLLGELPYVSSLFSSKSFQETEQEVVILVTPHLVDAQSCGQRPQVLPGQETRSPDDFELFLESILEAPRGPRTICHGRGYEPAFKHSPSYSVYPCAGCDGGHGAPGCGRGAWPTCHGCSKVPCSTCGPHTEPAGMEVGPMKAVAPVPSSEGTPEVLPDAPAAPRATEAREALPEGPVTDRPAAPEGRLMSAPGTGLSPQLAPALSPEAMRKGPGGERYRRPGLRPRFPAPEAGVDGRW
jgi:pilus assembly protein CpaC